MLLFFFFFKQKTAYEMRISDWSSDVCSSDLALFALPDRQQAETRALIDRIALARAPLRLGERVIRFDAPQVMGVLNMTPDSFSDGGKHLNDPSAATDAAFAMYEAGARSEEHTSELQSIMRISYAVFCLKKKKCTRALHTTTRHRQQN